MSGIPSFKTLAMTASLVLVSPVLLTLPGCQTDAPGIKSNFVQQWSTLDGSVEETTEAAAEVLESYELENVTSKNTKVDGLVTGEKADGKEISVDIRRVTDETSEASVRVGTVGDPDLGIEIVAKIKEKLSE
ncbi:MAG: DUF3568 family protein [Planctomycetota bacterium]